MPTFDNHTNFGYSVVTVAPAPAASGLTLEVDDPSVFPAAPFNATVCPPNVRPTASNAEVVRVTAIVGNQFTLLRAQEGSSAKSIAVGWQIANTVTRKVIVDVETAVNAPVNFSAGTTSNQTNAITFANSHGVTFGLNAGTITASVAPPSGALITVSAGTTDVQASQLLFSNANGVSFGLGGSTITATHNGLTSQSNQALSAANGSFAFQTASFSNANGVSFVTAAGSAIVASVAAQSHQTVGLYASSNTTLTSSGTVDARSLSVRAIGSLTAGYSAGELLLSAPNALTSQSNQAVSGANGSFAFQTLSFSNANGVSFGTSAGSAVTASHNGLTSQSTQYLALTLGGNTAGTTTFHATDNASLFLHGGNNITLSGNGASVTISGPNVGGAQTGISGIVASDATYTSGTVLFSNQANVTIGTSVDGASQYVRFSVAAQSNQTLGVYASSNTTLTSSGTIDARSLSVRAIGSLTAGVSNGELLLSAANALTSQSNQAVSADNGSYAFQTLSFSNANGFSFGTSAGSAITGSYTVPTVTNSSWTVSDAATSLTISRLAFTNSNGLTLTLSTAAGAATVIGSHNGLTAQSNQTVGWYASSNTTLTSSGTADARSLSVRAIGSLTAGFSNGELLLSAANALTSQSNQAFSAGGGSSAFQTLSFGNSFGVSFSNSDGSVVGSIATTYAGTGFTSAGANIGLSGTLNTSGLSLSATVAAQTNQTLGIYGSSNTTLTSSGTIDARSLSIRAIGNLSVGYSANEIILSGGTAAAAPVNFSAGTTSNNLGSVVFSDSNGLSFGLNGSTITASANTVGTATTYYPVASANSVGTVTRWAAEDHRHAGIGGIGISTGNTSGTSGSVVGTYWLAGSNAISVSQITSNNGSHTVNIYGPPPLSAYEPFPLIAPVSNSTLGHSTVHFVPFDVQHQIYASRINFFLSVNSVFSGAPNNITGSAGVGFALYTRGTGTASDRISTVTSYSLAYWSGSCSSSTRLSATYYIGLSNATSHSTSQYGVNNASVSNQIASSIAGFRVIALPVNLTLTPGRYWLAFSNQTTSNNGSFIINQSVLQQQVSNQLGWRAFNAVSAASNANAFAAWNGAGTYSAQTGAFPNTIPLTVSDIRVGPVVTIPYFNFSGIETATNIL